MYTAPAEFSRWLEPFQNVIYVAHNRKTFEFPVFISSVVESDSIFVFKNVLVGFIYSLRLLRKKYPDQ